MLVNMILHVRTANSLIVWLPPHVDAHAGVTAFRDSDITNFWRSENWTPKTLTIKRVP